MNHSTVRHRLATLVIGLTLTAAGIVIGCSASADDGLTLSSTDGGARSGVVLATWAWGDVTTTASSSAGHVGS